MNTSMHVINSTKKVKRKCIHFLAIALGFILSSSMNAQTMNIQGRLLDTENNELPAATVRCYVNDTVYVKGTTTNSKGEFELKVPQSEQAYKLLFTYLGYKEQTLLLNPTKEREVRLGEIVMNNNNIQMQEVTVVGENQIRTEDKLMIYPTKEQLRHAYDGYSALQVLTIPGIQTSIMDEQVSYMNEPVLLLIDGQEATQSELEDLNAKDISRVDFYHNGRPDYPQASAVVDFIIKERDYLGSIGINASQQLNLPMGNARGLAQYYQNRSEFALSISDSYQHSHTRNEIPTTTVYHHPLLGDITTVEQDLPTLDNNNGLKAYMNYIYRDKKQNMYVSLRFNRTYSQKEQEILTEDSYLSQTEMKKENRNLLNINPALQLRYVRSMKGNQRLRIEAYGSQGNNNYDRWYNYGIDDDITSSYRNSTDESSWYASTKINYTKTFKNKSSLNFEVNQDYTHTSDHNVKDEVPDKVYLKKANTNLYALYNYRIKNKFSLQARLAENLSYINTNERSNFTALFVPSIRLTYTHKEHMVSTQVTANSVTPDIANRTGDVYQRNRYELFVGNAQLKDYTSYEWAVNYTWTHNRLSILPYFRLNTENHYCYNITYYDEDHNSFVNTFRNGGRYTKLHYELQMQYELLPKMLTVSGGGSYAHTTMNLENKITNDRFMGAVNLTFMYKGWFMAANFMSKYKSIDRLNGARVTVPCTLAINVSYNLNGWNFTFKAYNPFRNTTESFYQNPDFSQSSGMRTRKLTNNYYLLSVNYRFTFGKKKHKFDNTQVNDFNQTTIKQ